MTSSRTLNPGRFAWLADGDALYVAALWGPLALLGIALKLYKAHALGALGGLGGALAVSAGDLVFFALGYVAWVAGLHAFGRRLRRAVRIAFHLVTPALAALLVLDHAFFRISGAIAEWHLLKDGIREFRALGKLYQTELSFGRALALTAPFVASALLFFSRTIIARLHAAVTASGAARWWRVVSRATPVGAVLAGLLGFAFTIPGGANALRRSTLPGLLADAAGDVVQGLSPRSRRASAWSAQRAPTEAPAALVRVGPGQARNAVVIGMESMGAIYTSLHGAPYDTTPFLKELASRGAFVERAYTVVPHTSKALVSLLCGVYPKLASGVDEAKHGLPSPCLPRLLRSQGYATAFFQTAEESYERRADLANEMGFERFTGKESIDAKGFDESSYFGWEDDAMIAPIAAWLDQQKDRPFFLTAMTLASHHPYSVPRGFSPRRYVADRELNDYLNTLAYTDRFVGKLYRELDRRGLLHNTLVVVIGDHGEGFGQHGRRQHDSVPYEEGIRVPLLLAGPEVRPGTRIGGLRQIVDVAPTVAHALGFKGSTPFFGRDLLGATGHAELFVSCYFNRYCAAIVEPERKTIHHFGRFPDQVFDLARDPGEANDLTRAPGVTSPDLVSGMVQRMKATIADSIEHHDARARSRAMRFVSRERRPFEGTATDALFGDSVRLLGYTIAPGSIEPGGRLEMTTYFEVLRAPPAGWELFCHFDGPSRVSGDHVPLDGKYRVDSWKAGEFIEDHYVLATRPSQAPGSYKVRMGFWHRSSGARVPVQAAAPLSVTADGRLELTSVDVTPRGIALADYVTSTAPAAAAATVRFGDWVRVAGASADRPATKAGLKVTATYLFEVLRDFGDQVELRIELDGPATRKLPHVPVFGKLPATAWRRGQFIRDPHDIFTLTSDPVGTYRILLSLVDRRTGNPVSPEGRGLSIDQGKVVAASYEIVR